MLVKCICIFWRGHYMVICLSFCWRDMVIFVSLLEGSQYGDIVVFLLEEPFSTSYLMLVFFQVQVFLCSENDTLSLPWLLFLSTMNWNEFQVTVLYIWSNLNVINVVNKLIYVSFQILNQDLNVSSIVRDVIFKSCGQRTYIEMNVAFVQIIY